MNVTAHATYQTITRAAEATGVVLPEPVRVAVDHAETVARATEGLGADAHVVAAVADALDRHVDPLDDDGVRRAACGLALVSANIGSRGRVYAAQRIETALVEGADSILEGFASVVGDAGQTLLAVAPHLPADLGSTGDVVRRGAEATDQWNNAQTATSRVRAALQAWDALAGLANLPYRDRVHAPLRLADLTLDQAERFRDEAARDHTDVDAWRIARAGIALDLPTATGWRERVNRYDTEVRDRDARREAEKNARGFSSYA